MARLLGIDTGGTYTDAVLLDDARPRDTSVIASAKALTTRHDLSIGIAEAMDAVFCEGEGAAGEIALVSLSTTLATNAVVEGQGGRVGLVLAGFGPEALERAGLRKALGEDPWLTVAGGHTAHGAPVHDVDLDAVRRWVQGTAGDVAGFAV
ncbi:MAG: hydantoinase/oxoprolinase N-terminal domain-containing protein, partial [Pseudomonadota bacterium]